MRRPKRALQERESGRSGMRQELPDEDRAVPPTSVSFMPSYDQLADVRAGVV